MENGPAGCVLRDIDVLLDPKTLRKNSRPTGAGGSHHPDFNDVSEIGPGDPGEP
jgi:hypothetical protein